MSKDKEDNMDTDYWNKVNAFGLDYLPIGRDEIFYKEEDSFWEDRNQAIFEKRKAERQRVRKTMIA